MITFIPIWKTKEYTDVYIHGMMGILLDGNDWLIAQ